MGEWGTGREGGCVYVVAGCGMEGKEGRREGGTEGGSDAGKLRRRERGTDEGGEE